MQTKNEIQNEKHSLNEKMLYTSDKHRHFHSGENMMVFNEHVYNLIVNNSF